MMYTPGAAMMYMGQLGGNARPVQRATPSKEQPATTTDSSFGFLGKSSKPSAFDFVREEMMASQMKK